ncbi:MAG: ferredoxin III, nif-specific [Magnetococcales bacterium]|nr:ferredoxin III, nif-specific [Magnetococcales bacterium]
MSEICFTSVTRSGSLWTPNFIVSLEGRRCIGCGRCFKVCPRMVFDLIERESVSGASGEESEEDWEVDGFADEPHMVMIIKDAGDCIGCAACSRVCPKRCHHHAPMPMAA